MLDVQIAVAALDPLEPFRQPLEALGFVFRANNPDRMKRYFREAPGTPRTHIHVRQRGSVSEQLALLFRDYVRTHADEAARYARLKAQLAVQYRDDRVGYTEAKSPFIWEVLRRADTWAQRVGWASGPSDC